MSTTTAIVGQTVDVIVVGGGGAGLAASISAAAANRSVLLLEKEPKLGGTTGLSVGSITASATALQRRAGIVDSPAQHFEDMALFAGELAVRDNLELRRLYTENVPDTVAWLENLGVVFFGPMPEPPHRVPRMHNVLPSSKAYIHQLWKEARRLGVKALLNARAQKLITTGGRVTGVEAVVNGRIVQLNATCAVVLASGDFSSGRELKQKYLAEDIRDIDGINPASTGDGQRLALEVGGDIVNGDIVFGPEIRFVVPPVNKLVECIPPSTQLARIMRRSLTLVPSAILRPLLMMFITTNLAPSPSLLQKGAILVNKLGKRFVNELDKPVYAIPRQPEQMAYIVFDNKVAATFTGWPNFISTAPGLAYAYLADYKRNRRDIYFQADSIRALAHAFGVPVDALAQTIAEHNRSPAGQAAPLATPPFYALGPAKSWIAIADGGLKVNANLQVLDRSGQCIPGLFAAGSTGQGGLLLEGHGHHLGWALTSGRIAGRNAARATET
jgi:succinate dehydrogenase/fumarate reductase flavoprotein subunit